MVVVRTLLVCLTMLLVPVANGAESNVVRLTSTEWPPYSSDSLKGQGASAVVLRAAFEAVGYRLEIEFYPWLRATKLAADPREPYHGYFPEYYDPGLAETMTYSVPIGSGPLGFAERVEHPVQWATLDDLAKYRIGTVNGYVNTEAFDSLVSSGKIRTDAALSDTNNLLKLEAGRVDLAVVDRNVFNFILDNDPAFKDKRHLLRFNDHILEKKQLFVCFRKGELGKRMERELAKGLKKINPDALVAGYLKSLSDGGR